MEPATNTLKPQASVRYAYAIFQGGGARGFAHVAGVKAAEEARFFFLGVAGTSAGAVIASLLAVGYKADEIYDPARPDDHILRSYGSPIGVLGERDWRRIAGLRKNVTSRDRWMPFRLLRSLPRLASAAVTVLRHRGLLDTESFIETLNELLRARLIQNYEREKNGSFTNAWVTFKDIDRFAPGCRPLKIIATDLSRNRVVVYSTEDTPDVRVAEAVAASAAVPLLFRPTEVKWTGGDTGRIYVDGGLVSNLPVWAFRDERLADLRKFSKVVALAFGFEEEAVVESRPPVRFGFASYLHRIGNAALATGQSLTSAFVDDLVVVPLRSTLGMLDLDATAKEYAEAYRASHASARERIEYIFERRPETIRGALWTFRDAAVRKLEDLGLPPGTSVRVCAIAPIRSLYGRARIRNFAVLASLGFEDDCDDRLILDANNKGAPLAYEQRRPVPWKTSSLAGGACPKEPMTKYERAWVRPTLRSSLSVPVFSDSRNWQFEPRNRDTPVGLVSIDCDVDCTTFFADSGFLEVAVENSSPLRGIFGA